jgi:hypothetical protein
METIGAVRQNPGMEVSVGESQLSVRNGATGRQPTGGTEGSSGGEVGTPLPQPEPMPEPEPTTEPEPGPETIEGYAEAKALIPQMFEILEASTVFQELAIKPFTEPDDPNEYIPLVMNVRRQKDDIDGMCSIEVRDPSDTTTPGGRWLPLYTLSRELPGFDPNQHLRLSVYIALGGMISWHPAGMALIMSHELALHGLSSRKIILRARREGWALRALRDFYVNYVECEEDHWAIRPGTHTEYEAVNNDLERVLQLPRWRRFMTKIRSSYVTPVGERPDPSRVLLALPARAVAAPNTSLYNLNLNHQLYSAYQLFVFDRQMEKDVFYNPDHFFTFLGQGSRIDTRTWDYLDTQQGGR